MKLLVVGIVCFTVISGERARYDSYRLYSVKVENENQLAVLNSINGGIAYLEIPTSVGQQVEIVVPPHKLAYIAELFEEFHINNKLKTDNLQKYKLEKHGPSQRSSSFAWNNYYDLNAIYAWIDELGRKYPKVATNINYGLSYEGRWLRAVRVSHNNRSKPSIFIESMSHPNDFIAVSTATYFLNELITSTDDKIRALADTYDWIFVPVANVDGYEYTHTTDRLWRKTRKPQTILCRGADLTRNFDFNRGIRNIGYCV